MKRYLLLLVMAATVGTSVAQTAKEMAEKRKEVMSMSKEEMSAKASKAAEEEAKRYEKEGWKVAPGSLPLKAQLDKSYAIQQQYDENFESKFVMGQAISVGSTYDAARMQAVELAKQELAGMIGSVITAQTETAIANKQLSNEEAISITQTIQKSRNQVAQRIGKVIVAVELYRDNEAGKEVLVRIAYNMDNAKRIALETMREELTKMLDNLNKKLEELMQ